MSAYFEVSIRVRDIANSSKSIELFSSVTISLPLYKITALVTQPALLEDMQDADTVLAALYKGTDKE